MSIKTLKPFASLLTVPATLLILYHLAFLIFDYSTLARGEGWGVVYVFGALFWLIVILIVGVVIRKFIKSTRLKWIIESIIFLFCAIFIYMNL